VDDQVNGLLSERPEEAIIGSTLPFPAFDEWEKMSESEQDARIARSCAPQEVAYQ
jgi:hypothetical protein